jgi:hypothetical protein
MKILGQIKNAYYGLIQKKDEAALYGGLYMQFDFGGPDREGIYQLIYSTKNIADETGETTQVLTERTQLFWKSMEILEKSGCAHIGLLKDKFVIATIENDKIASIQFSPDNDASIVMLTY